MNSVWKKPLFAILAFFAALIGANLVAYTFSSTQTSHEFLKAGLEKMKMQKPDIVLIGDSMLGHSVDPKLFSKLTGLKTLKLDKPGSSSAGWYLTLKNIVVEAEKRPAVAAIFFRDCFLTMPRYRVSGDFRLHIEDLSPKSEPLVEALSYGDSRAEIGLSRIFPLFRHRRDVRHRVDSWVKDDIVSSALFNEEGFAQEKIERIFSDSKMDKEMLNAAQVKAEAETEVSQNDFASAVASSYLPALIKEARDASIDLILVRVRRRRDARNQAQPPELVRYNRDLSAYLQKQDIPLVDFTHEKQITVSLYAEGDHLSDKKGKRIFTTLFAGRMKKYLKDKAPHKSRR